MANYLLNRRRLAFQGELYSEDGCRRVDWVQWVDLFKHVVESRYGVDAKAKDIAPRTSERFHDQRFVEFGVAHTNRFLYCLFYLLLLLLLLFIMIMMIIIIIMIIIKFLPLPLLNS